MRRRRIPTVLVSLLLNGATGRNELMGVLKLLSRGVRWNLQIPMSAAALNDALVRGEVDGVIVGLQHDARTLEILKSSSVPAVLLDISPDHIGNTRSNVIYVRNDDTAIGAMAVEHFRTIGRFASYAYIPSSRPRPWSMLREKSFIECLERRQLSASVFSAPQGDGREALSDFLSRLSPPAAVFAACDFRAQEVISAARAMKLEVPKRLAVLGVDNDEIICENFHPAISSVRPNHEKMGFLAAQELERLMRGGDGVSAPPSIVTVSPIDTVVRESTGSSRPSSALVDRARAYVREHICENVTPVEIARALRVSRRLLDLRFHEASGTTAAGMIRDLRLKELKMRLRLKADRPISSVTRELGFTNDRQAKNLFRRTFGMTMSTWRKKGRKGA